MILTTHQPIFMPWPGFFYKAMESDCMVLLDEVQFPRGRTWLTRNRLKNEDGEVWLTVPVRRKGLGLQTVGEVEVYEKRSWRRKHLESIRQNYVHAPYFREYDDDVETIYAGGHTRLVDHNVELIRFLWSALGIERELLLQSELGVAGRGTDVLIAACERTHADRYAVFPMAEKYIDVPKLERRGVRVLPLRFRPPVYPQLWGDFIYNLSTLDLLLNCGPRSRTIIAEA